MSITFKFTKFEVKEIKKRIERKYHSYWSQPTSKLEFHSTDEQKIKEETIEESLGLGKKPKPIPKLNLGFGCRNQVLVVHYSTVSHK